MGVHKIWAGFSAALLAGALILPACEITRDGTTGDITVRPADGRPRKVPPERISEIWINGKCYIQMKGPSGELYCIPCDFEGTGYAEPCSTYTNQQQLLGDPTPGGPGVPTTPCGPIPPAGTHLCFLALLDEVLIQEGVARTSDAIMAAYGFDLWQEGDDASVPVALNKLDVDDNYIDIMMLARSDWDWPDDSTGAQVEWLLFGDPSDTVPEAMAIRVSGTIEQVSDAMAGVFIDGFTWNATMNGSDVDIISTPSGSSFVVTAFVDGQLVWQR